MRILLFGSAGQVGTDCVVQLGRAGLELVPLSRKELDFADAAAVTFAVETHQPDLVVNACAYTAVDQAESEDVVAEQVNHLSVAALARVCASGNIPLIHLSTDYVFDGLSKTPYRESDPVHPLGVYGHSKQRGEQAIKELCSSFIILRTSWVFGEHGNNFVKTMLRVGAERDFLTVVDDQYGRPTYVGDIVSTILAFIQRYKTLGNLPWGIYHCSSTGETTWYQFAKAIFSKALNAKALDKVPDLKPIVSAEYPTIAPRPAYSVLDTKKLEAFLGHSLPHWQQGLEQFYKNRITEK
ncbi:MAG: dTDP-4-dehydrorhamnose reductase [Cellvibrionaceae bacterium]|jgi:dTDP-4-dehydrorhamnose reductase